MSITLTSSAFADGDAIPTRYSQDGENLSPPLAWGDVPPATAELALIVDDPDASPARPYVHWVLYGIPAGRHGLPEGVPKGAAPAAVPGAQQGPNDRGGTGWDGPGPPRGHGVHHYRFTLLALREGSALPRGLDKVELLKAIEGRMLDRGELVGTFERR